MFLLGPFAVFLLGLLEVFLLKHFEVSLLGLWGTVQEESAYSQIEIIDCVLWQKQRGRGRSPQTSWEMCLFHIVFCAEA